MASVEVEADGDGRRDTKSKQGHSDSGHPVRVGAAPAPRITGISQVEKCRYLLSGWILPDMKYRHFYVR